MDSEQYAIKYQQLINQDLHISQLKHRLMKNIINKCVKNYTSTHKTQQLKCIDQELKFVGKAIQNKLIPEI